VILLGGWWLTTLVVEFGQSGPVLQVSRAVTAVTTFWKGTQAMVVTHTHVFFGASVVLELRGVTQICGDSGHSAHVM
jgi:hypothetical protein